MRQVELPLPEPTPRPAARPVVVDGAKKSVIETGRNRLMVTGAVFALCFLGIAGRLVDIAVLDGGREPRIARAPAMPETVERADITDRNGVILATSLPTVSLYADPQGILDAQTAARKLVRVLPDLDEATVLSRLNSGGRFVYLRRNLTPKQQYEVNALGIPGLGFENSERRVYPHGREAAHVLGLTDVDNHGIAGVERRFDDRLSHGEGVQLALDIRVQSMVREQLAESVAEFNAIGGAAVVLDARRGETVALVSLPDFDPNDRESMTTDTAFNRVTKGVYEMGSTFKLFTAAMALDSGTVTLSSGYDASKPIHVARFTIHDDHAQNRWLTVPEILVHSSNIGAAKMALDVGTETQRAYLGRLGLLQEANLELPEVGAPLYPHRWREINTMTVSYGHGIAVSPLQVASAVATLVNGGIRHDATLLYRTGAGEGERVLSAKTSKSMRGLMELVVEEGTGKKARVPGYRIGGKTGTAEKQVGGRYKRHALISSFVGAFPIDDPRYVVLVVLDEPKGNKRTFNFAAGGWVAAPAVGRIVRNLAGMEGIAPMRAPENAVVEAPPADDLLVTVRAAIADARGPKRVAN